MQVSADGAFLFSALPAGEYVVAAVEAGADPGWRDPAVLERLSAGAPRLTLGSHDRRFVTARTR